MRRWNIFLAFLVLAWGQGSKLQTAGLNPRPVDKQVVQKMVGPATVGLGLMPYSSDIRTAEPEEGAVKNGIYRNNYFGLTYPLPMDWFETAKGPPPSNSGYYVLSQLASTTSPDERALIAISASDMFFQALPANTSLDVLEQVKRQLSDALQIESPPVAANIGKHLFARLDYTGVGLHWRLLVTQVRCHALQFAFTSPSTRLLDGLVRQFEQVKLFDISQSKLPVCIKDYANGGAVLHRVDPVLVGPRFTTVAARMIIDKRGAVKHIHVFSAFPEQARSVSGALGQWKFRPHIENGTPVEVETGILFDFSPGGVRTKSAVDGATISGPNE